MKMKVEAYVDGVRAPEHDTEMEVPDLAGPDTDALREKVRAATNTATLKAALLDVLDALDERAT